MDEGEEGSGVECEWCSPPEMGSRGVRKKIKLRTGEVVAVL